MPASRARRLGFVAGVHARRCAAERRTHGAGALRAPIHTCRPDAAVDLLHMRTSSSNVVRPAALPLRTQPASCQDVTSCRGMRLSPAGAALLAAFTAITGGLFGLLALWLPHVRHALLYRSCPLEAAHYVHFQVCCVATAGSQPAAGGGPAEPIALLKWFTRPSAWLDSGYGRIRGRACMSKPPYWIHKRPATRHTIPQLRDGRFGVVRVEVAEQGAGAPPLRVATFQQARYVMAPPGGDDSAGGGLEGRGLAFTRVPKVAPEAAARLPAVAAALARDRAAAPPPFHRDVAARAAAAARYGPNLMVGQEPRGWCPPARLIVRAWGPGHRAARQPPHLAEVCARSSPPTWHGLLPGA